MPSRVRSSVSEPTRGLLDTSEVINHDVIDVGLLPDESAVAAITHIRIWT
jgi:hypothetical protein